MKKILICGATGFIGRNLAEHFSKSDKYDVRATFHNRPPVESINVEWVYADLNNPEDVRSVVQDCDIVLQFAATTSGAGDIVNRPHIHVTDNAVMNSLILRQCYENSVERFLFPSCTVMYQPSEAALSESDYKESDEILNNYFGVGNTKVYIEKMCQFFSRLGRTKHTVLRQSNIYGPHDKYDLKKSHVFGATVTKVMTNTTGTLEVWGTGEEKRDLLHVDDLVRAIDLSIENQQEPYALFNIGLGKASSINQLVDKMIESSNKKIAVSHNIEKPTIKTSLFLDCSKSKEAIGWEPAIDLEQGIEKTLNWYKENILGE